jgi:hypothetical protein
MAVGTTYSLDLLALMTAPVAFALFDRQRGDGSPIDDPIATLQALREYASRITLFCQAGQIAVPPDFRNLLVYLEDCVHPVVPPDSQAIFHPKVWFIRFRSQIDDAASYRLLCLSRNLTFDRSWDTVLRLEGEAGDAPSSPELARFAESLVTMAERTRAISPDRVEAIIELGHRFSRVNWTLPDGFDAIRFWPLGDDGVNRWPFEGRRDRMLVVSPFVTQGTLGRLTKGHRGSILVSRPETLDTLGKTATKHLSERLVLSPEASNPAHDEVGTDRTDSIAESAGHRLEGLHAKTYVADAGWRARVWTGSANATDAAFHGNVEFLVELGGKNIGSERWRLTLAGVPTVASVEPATLEGISATVRPVTLGRGLATTLDLDAASLEAVFDVSEPAITPYFAVTLAINELEVAFLVVAELIDPPADRADRVLSSLLTNRADLLRFLLLLLGNIEDALAGFISGEDDGPPNGGWLPGLESEALLEPLVRAYSRDPHRIREIERVMIALSHRLDAESLLPERWDEIWRPIAAALEQDSA